MKIKWEYDSLIWQKPMTKNLKTRTKEGNKGWNFAKWMIGFVVGNGLLQIIRYQQHFFLSFSFFFWVNFLVGTSTGMKLLYQKNTFILACFIQMPERFSRKPPQCLHGSLRWCSSARSWGAFAGTSSQLPPRLLVQIIYRFCCPQGWKGIFRAPSGLPGSWTNWSMIRYYRRTRVRQFVLFCLWCHKPRHSNLLHDRKRRPNSWIFPDRQCPISKCCFGGTSRLMTLPSTITSFSMKSAPTVAL